MNIEVCLPTLPHYGKEQVEINKSQEIAEEMVSVMGSESIFQLELNLVPLILMDKTLRATPLVLAQQSERRKNLNFST